jgi:glyoxylase-like metal-dependent hydrolase (beta-lactamase superfamily II)
MQEIANKIYIETGYPGVTLGVIDWNHGLLLIDAPFRVEDARAWRTALLNLGGGIDRLLVNLDSHVDRTFGSRSMDCTVIGHEKMTQVFRSRPISFKNQAMEMGAELELYNNLGSTRWLSPEITFSDRIEINHDAGSVVLEHHPGPTGDAIWVIIPKEGVVFLGDAVICDQPPYLWQADIPAWLEQLHLLTSNPYKNFLLVSGRGGLIPAERVKEQIKLLEKILKQIEGLVEKGAQPADTARLVSGIMKGIDFQVNREALYRKRLTWGLAQYYQVHFMRADGKGLEKSETRTS